MGKAPLEDGLERVTNDALERAVKVVADYPDPKKPAQDCWQIFSKARVELATIQGMRAELVEAIRALKTDV